MKITQDVRDYADGLSENEKAALYPDEAQTRGVEGALATDREIKKGMDEMSKKFEEMGGKLYLSEDGTEREAID